MKFYVTVQEERSLEIEADSEAQIREWFENDGPGSLQRYGNTDEVHDRILSIEAS